MEKHGLKERLHSNYHWVVASVAFLEFFIAVGLANNVYGLYLIPVTTGLGISRGAYSIPSSVKCIAGFLSNLSFGFFYHRFGYKKLATVAMLLSAIGYVGYGLAQNIMPFYAGAILIGVVEAYYSMAATSRLVTDWFHKHRGLVLGIVMAASGVGGSLFSILLTKIMTATSWRTSYLISAATFLIPAVAILFFVPDRPEQIGLKPFGDREDLAKDQEKYGRVVEEWEGIPISYLRKTGAFYLILIATFLIGTCIYGLYPVVAAHVQDQGMSQEFAAEVQSILFIGLAVAKIVEGMLTDRFGGKPVMFFTLACSIFGTWMFAVAKTPLWSIVGVSIFSFALAIPSNMFPVLATELFGRHDSSSLLGMLLAMISLSSAASSPLVNFTYDRFGTYIPVMIALALVSVAATVLYAVVFVSAGKLRKKWEAEHGGN